MERAWQQNIKGHGRRGRWQQMAGWAGQLPAGCWALVRAFRLPVLHHAWGVGIKSCGRVKRLNLSAGRLERGQHWVALGFGLWRTHILLQCFRSGVCEGGVQSGLSQLVGHWCYAQLGCQGLLWAPGAWGKDWGQPLFTFRGGIQGSLLPGSAGCMQLMQLCIALCDICCMANNNAKAWTGKLKLACMPLSLLCVWGGQA